MVVVQALQAQRCFPGWPNFLLSACGAKTTFAALLLRGVVQLCGRMLAAAGLLLQLR